MPNYVTSTQADYFAETLNSRFDKIFKVKKFNELSAVEQYAIYMKGVQMIEVPGVNDIKNYAEAKKHLDGEELNDIREVQALALYNAAYRRHQSHTKPGFFHFFKRYARYKEGKALKEFEQKLLAKGITPENIFKARTLEKYDYMKELLSREKAYATTLVLKSKQDPNLSVIDDHFVKTDKLDSVWKSMENMKNVMVTDDVYNVLENNDFHMTKEAENQLNTCDKNIENEISDFQKNCDNLINAATYVPEDEEVEEKEIVPEGEYFENDMEKRVIKDADELDDIIANRTAVPVKPMGVHAFETDGEHIVGEDGYTVISHDIVDDQASDLAADISVKGSDAPNKEQVYININEIENNDNESIKSDDLPANKIEQEMDNSKYDGMNDSEIRGKMAEGDDENFFKENEDDEVDLDTFSKLSN